MYNDTLIKNFFDIYKDYSSEVRKQYYSLLDKLKNIGIYSLSKNNDNELLWAYYASGHSGFAIEYDIDILKHSLNYNAYFQLVYDFDVDYVKCIPEADISYLHAPTVINFIKTYLGTKSLSWRHEKEYRLIFEKKGLFDIDYRAVTGIYFGYRMNDSEVDLIMNRLKGRGLNYYKMKLIKNSYEFKPYKIEDKYTDSPKYIANDVDYDIDCLLLPKNILGEEAYSYKSKLIDALEIVTQDPLIKEIYIATINMDLGEPVFIIWAYTKSGIPPCKQFRFKLNPSGEIFQI